MRDETTTILTGMIQESNKDVKKLIGQVVKIEGKVENLSEDVKGLSEKVDKKTSIPPPRLSRISWSDVMKISGALAVIAAAIVTAYFSAVALQDKSDQATSPSSPKLNPPLVVQGRSSLPVYPSSDTSILK